MATSSRRWSGTLASADDRVIFLVSVAIFLAIWQSVATGFSLSDTISSPWLIAKFMVEVFQSGVWVKHYVATLRRILYAFVFSMVVGVAVGILMGVTTFWKQVLQYYVLIGLALPAVVAALFAAMWFGLSELTPMLATAVGTVPFVSQNIHESVEDVDSGIVNMAKSFNLSRRRVIRRIIVQSVMPEIFASLRYTFSVAWKITAITEVIISTTGVGYLIRINQNQLDMTGLLTYVLIFTIIVLVIEYGIFKRLESWMFEWRQETSLGL